MVVSLIFRCCCFDLHGVAATLPHLFATAGHDGAMMEDLDSLDGDWRGLDDEMIRGSKMIFLAGTIALTVRRH